MELHIQVNGMMINNMDMEFKNGLMEPNMKGIFNKDSRKDMGPFHGQMVVDIKANLKTTTLRGLGITHGLMAVSTKVPGGITKCTEEVYFCGRMDVNMKGNMLMIKNKVMGNLVGQMGGHTKDSGRMVSKMGKERTRISKEFREMEYGQMVRKLNGVTDII